MNTMQPANQALVLRAIGRVACAEQAGNGTVSIWSEFERSLTEVFGQRLFTVLAYDAASKRLARLHSNRLDINPVGGVKRVTASRWARQVLQQGECFIGSTRQDIQAVFSDFEVLWGIGCESVLNIPVRSDGVTLGTFNLLGAAGQYDHVDPTLAIVFAQIAVAPLAREAGRLRELPDPDCMQQV